MNSPKLSIITVVYNGFESIEDTLSNVCNLSYPNLNYIVIDGGSEDGTQDLLKKYEPNFAQNLISYKWISGRDSGLYDAMNKGWNMADENSYILFLGSGDKVLKLPRAVSFENADIVYGNVWAGDYFFNSKIDIRLKLGNMLHHQALFVYKQVCPYSPFNLNYKVYADFDFNQRMLKQGKRFVKDDEFLGYALEGGVSSIYNYKEAYAIIHQNYGWIYVCLARVYYFLQKNIRVRLMK